MSQVLESANGQLGFDLGDTSPSQRYVPDIDGIRCELNAVLDSLRAATHSWQIDARALRFQKTVFPQMLNWLPVAEQEEMRAAFSAEIARIEAIKA